MTAVGEPILELITLRAADDTAVTGAVAGDFDRLEAFALAAPLTLAAVTLTELGDGEYRASYTPTVAGRWVLVWRFVVVPGVDVVSDTRETDVAALPGADIVVASGDPYVTVAQFKARQGITDTDHDIDILATLRAASRQIDGFCGRVFTQATGTRYVTPGPRALYGGKSLAVRDLVSLTTLSSDDTDWDVGDYALAPADAADCGIPYREVRAVNGRRFPSGVESVALTGVWGWPAVPAQVIEACFLMTNRFKSLWQAPFGLSGPGGDLGALDMTTSITPLIKDLLRPLRVKYR